MDKKTFLETVATIQNQIKDDEETEDTKDLIKSVNELKKEAKAFVTKNGYSKLLSTHIFFKKIFWLVTWFPLFGICLHLVIDLLKQYSEYGVVTQIKISDQIKMTFPALTFCLQKIIFSSGMLQFKTLNLSDVWLNCSFGEKKSCTQNDFFNFQIFHMTTGFDNSNISYNCYQLNGGRGANNSNAEILTTPNTGSLTGFFLQFNLTEEDVVFYYVGDNNVQPVYNELENTLQSGINALISFKKTIETRLPKPYSNCTQNINSEYSEMVKEAIQTNFTYRRVNCFNSCMLKMQKLNGSFTDNIAFCSDSCPLECQTISFDSNRNSVKLPQQLSSYLSINFFYSSNKYTDLTQSVQTSNRFDF